MTEVPTGPSTHNKMLLGVAFGIAAIVGTLAVLAAEFGIDPTGFGQATGLTAISDQGMNAEQKRGALRSGVLVPIPGTVPLEPGKRDHFEIELPPYASIELKYEVAQDKSFVFSWRTSKPVHFDMHAHPFKGGTDLTESYAISNAAEQQGRYVAPFTGIHGWYWQNRHVEPVKLTLDASGAIIGSRIFDDSGEHRRPLKSPS